MSGQKFIEDAIHTMFKDEERIIGLVEALEVFQSYGCPVCAGDCASANPPVAGCPMRLAHDALIKAKGTAGPT